MRRIRTRRDHDDPFPEEGPVPGGERPGAAGGLRIQITAEGLALVGEIDLATREALAGALAALEQVRLAGEIVIDLSGLTFIDGRGASLLADAARKLGPARTLVLRGAGQSVRTVIDALRLDAADNVVVES